jgi:hypothetical protein
MSSTQVATENATETPRAECSIIFGTGVGGDYGSFASFSDPDGNGWLVQEIETRAPGR